MSLISQTTSYTNPGTYTYTVPQGVGSLEFHIWGAGGANGGHGPTTQIQTGTTVTEVQTGTRQVQTGTRNVDTGTRQVQTGTIQVQVGTTQEAYTVSVPITNSKGGTVDRKGNPTGGKGQSAVQYTTQTQYRTVPVYETHPVYSIEQTFEVQPTYTSEIVYTTVDIPIYGSSAGGNGGAGAGAGYSSRKIQVNFGDVIVVYVGSTGVGPVGGTSANFNGGSAGQAINGAYGGGGGAATVVTINGDVVAVAAGGGGGGGGGISGELGTDATAATISGVGSGTSGVGASSPLGPATGGGGGGGFYGGSAGNSGNKGFGGQGGVSFGTIIQAGSGTVPGGIAIAQYPGNNVGYAAHNGAAVLIFNKSFNINIKRNEQWDVVNSAWVKVGGNWKEIANGWTKVAGVWKPLISPEAVVGAENLDAPAATYSLIPDSISISEGGTVTFTLSTTGLDAGTIVPYTATGISSYDLDVGSLSGNFVVGTTDDIIFTPSENHITNGARTLRVSIDNTTTSATCTIVDSSITPIYTIDANVATMDEGDSVRFTLSSISGISGESINYEITGIDNDRITAGSLSGTFVVGSAETADITVGTDYTTTGETLMTMTLLGKGATATCLVYDTSLTPSGVATGTTAGVEWIVPAGVYSAVVTAIGGGGGGGGCDSHAGYNGYSGDKITGTISVTPGQVYTLYSGNGGAGGVSDQGSAPGGGGGIGYVNGGAGSAAGPNPYSGGGGGGGAGSALILSGIPVLFAAGGGGGGGGGHHSTGHPQQGIGGALSSAGGAGTTKGGDGGGAGGGGSGYPLGGAGGAVAGGDNGGYSGNNGQRVVPNGCTVTTANNGGSASYRGGASAQAGSNGSIVITWG